MSAVNLSYKTEPVLARLEISIQERNPSLCGWQFQQELPAPSMFATSRPVDLLLQCAHELLTMTICFLWNKELADRQTPKDKPMN